MLLVVFQLPDHFWFTPRAFADDVFDILKRYAQCGRDETRPTAAKGNSSIENSCQHMRLCRLSSGRAAPSTAPSTARSAAGSSISSAHQDKDADARLPPLCCGGGPTGLVVRALLRIAHSTDTSQVLSVVLLEAPMFIVGRLWTAAKMCTNSLATTQLGYFRTRSDCVLASAACAAD